MLPHLLAACAALAPAPQDPAPAPFTYPDAPREDVVEVLHGVEVHDPYRWLEDLDSERTRAWIEAENALTRAFLDVPERERIRARLEAMWDHPRQGVPRWRGERLFYTVNDGLQPQPVLVVREGLDGPTRVLIDPNTFSEDGTVALGGTSVSKDGRWLAWARAEAGSDWRTWHVRDVETGEDLPDVLRWVKFSGVTWAPDGSGFWYARYPEPEDALADVNLDQTLWFHRRGTDQSEDLLVYARPDHPRWGFGTEVTEDGRLLVITVWEGTAPENRVHLLPLDEPGAEVMPLFDEADAQYGYVGQAGDRLLFFTNRDAERGRVISVDPSHPEPDAWQEVVPEGPDAISSLALVGGRLVVHTLHDASSRLHLYGLAGEDLGEVALPGLGTVSGVRGDPDHEVTWFRFSSFTEPTTVYRLDVREGSIEPWFRPEVDFDPEPYVTRQVFAISRDGTRVPLFLTHRRDLALDGTAPTLLYGYGGFDIAITPWFSVPVAVWLEMGGVYAQAVLRGGGEYGEAWHRAGMLENKQHVFDDFIACGEWLVEEGVTNPERLAIQGRSNGGLLVGAVLNQRPDLFGAALPGVGVMDMLRFHRWTIGWAWTSEYGSPDDPEMFPVLRAYSPYHNVRPGTRYPAVLVTTADHDDRVYPAHSFKYAAALQYAQAGPDPVLIRIETRAGHGGGKPTAMRIDEAADEWTFLARTLEMSLPALPPR